jgi:GntR family transcriptional regulator / MocR family aminotransferase
VPPASLAAALCKARQIGNWHSCALTQTALARFMLDGDFAKHLRRVHKHYAARRQVLPSIFRTTRGRPASNHGIENA